MDQCSEDLGLRPDLSPLPSAVRDLIHHGSSNGDLDDSEAAVAVCAALFRAGYGVDEVWMIMTDPRNGISKGFFSLDGEQAEVWLDRVISEADGEATKAKSCTPTLLHPDGGGAGLTQ